MTRHASRARRPQLLRGSPAVRLRPDLGPIPNGKPPAGLTEEQYRKQLDEDVPPPPFGRSNGSGKKK